MRKSVFLVRCVARESAHKHAAMQSPRFQRCTTWEPEQLATLWSHIPDTATVGSIIYLAALTGGLFKHCNARSPDDIMSWFHVVAIHFAVRLGHAVWSFGLCWVGCIRGIPVCVFLSADHLQDLRGFRKSRFRPVTSARFFTCVVLLLPSLRDFIWCFSLWSSFPYNNAVCLKR